jgi:hypothetical protein
MTMRVLFAWAAEANRRESGKPELGGIERRVLAGEDQARRESAGGKRMGYGRQLDRFRPVPTTSRISAKRSLPPSSAGAICLGCGATSSRGHDQRKLSA